MSDYWTFLESFFAQIFAMRTPWGIAFGAVVVGIFGAPLIVRAYKKFF